MSDAPVLHPKTFEEAFPSRFLKAALLDGRKVTLTIREVFTEELVGEKTERHLILSFVERDKELVCNKTNAICLRAMFGNKLENWKGKKVCWFPTTTLFGGKTVECIRVYGSPNIQEKIEVNEHLGRKNFKTTLHPTTGSPKPSGTDPRIAAKWEILGWSKAEGEKHRSNLVLSQDEYLQALDLELAAQAEKGAF